MSILDKIVKQSPAIILISLILSALYNAGFLKSSSSIDLLTNLTYQDIIISAIFFIPIFASFFGILFIAQRYAFIFYNSSSKLVHFVYFVSATIGLAIGVFTGFGLSGIGWIIFMISILPYIVRYMKYMNFPFDENTVIFSSMLLAGSLIAFGQGYSDYATTSCFKEKSISVSGCNDCILIKIYTEFILVKNEGSPGILVVPNTHEFEITNNEPDFERIAQDPSCNPLATIFTSSEE